MYLNVPKQPIVVLNNPEVVFELLEKRSDIYSSRTEVVMDEL